VYHTRYLFNYGKPRPCALYEVSAIATLLLPDLLVFLHETWLVAGA